MNAKKLTMAVASLMVLAAAFVLVVPSESDAAEEFQITEAYFQDYPTYVAVKVFFNQPATEGGTFALYYGDELVKKLEIRPGQSDIKVKLGDVIPRGEYTAYITTPNGDDSTTILYPTPVEHTISVLASPVDGGQITADKTAAYYGDIVTLTIVPAEGYKLTKLTLNGQAIQGSTFEMPNNDVMIVAMFEPAIVYCDVTFVVSSDLEPVTVKAVSGEILQDVPPAPELIGVQFAGWFCEGADEAFDFATTPVTENLTVYAHYGPEAPSTEQTTKFVASIAVEEDACKLVTTAYDGNVIGKGTAAIDVYMMWDGNYVFVDQVEFAIDGKDVYSVDDITEAILTIATEPGQYAVMSTITLDSGASAITNFALFEIEAQA
jgi:uncharacterized repeat protein (TIGR02543 family)